jgi:UDP-glucuronate decarboxylase
MRFNDGRVVSNFIVQALSNNTLTNYGDGRQTRSFCYVDDLIEAILGMSETETDFCGPMNIGNDREFTMQELAETVIQLTGSNSEIVYTHLPLDDPQQRKPDLTLAKTAIGWEPKTTLEAGLLKTIENFRARIRNGEKVSQ